MQIWEKKGKRELIWQEISWEWNITLPPASQPSHSRCEAGVRNERRTKERKSTALTPLCGGWMNLTGSSGWRETASLWLWSLKLSGQGNGSGSLKADLLDSLNPPSVYYTWIQCFNRRKMWQFLDLLWLWFLNVFPAGVRLMGTNSQAGKKRTGSSSFFLPGEHRLSKHRRRGVESPGLSPSSESGLVPEETLSPSWQPPVAALFWEMYGQSCRGSLAICSGPKATLKGNLVYLLLPSLPGMEWVVKSFVEWPLYRMNDCKFHNDLLKMLERRVYL